MRGTSSNTMSVYRDCRTPLPDPVDPADPPVPLRVLGGSFSELPRACSGLWVRDSLIVGVCNAPVSGESVMLTSSVVTTWGVVVSGGGGGVSLSAADIGAAA